MNKTIMYALAFVVTALLLAGSDCGTDQQEIFEYESLAAYGPAAQWSSDGAHVVFERLYEGVFVVRADGSQVWRLPLDLPYGDGPSRFRRANFSPAVSPDGSRVAYTTVDESVGLFGGDQYDIAVSNIDGSGFRKLTDDSNVDAYPAWSPDGRRIVFYSLSSDRARTARLEMMDATGENRRTLWSGLQLRILRPPAWSPDGSHVAFVTDDLVDLFREYELPAYVNTIQLGTSEIWDKWTILGMAVSGPVWSPDSSRIAYWTDEDGVRTLYSMGPQGGHRRVEATGTDDSRGETRSAPGMPWYSATPALSSQRWGGRSDYAVGSGGLSPDGSETAFAAYFGSGDVVYVVGGEGSARRVLVVADHQGRLTNMRGQECSGVSFTPGPEQVPGAIEDCAVLLGIKDSLRGEALLNWDADTPIFHWEGVTFEDQGSRYRVTKLQFNRWSPLTGVLPPELGSLTSLRSLELPRNSLSGTVPPELGNLTNLKILDLSHNGLGGTIPRELGNLANLKTLNLAYNNLAGAIPPEFGNLTSLDELDLSNNSLTGAIPPELGNLTRLSRLDLSDNKLTGCVPVRARISIVPGGLGYC